MTQGTRGSRIAGVALGVALLAILLALRLPFWLGVLLAVVIVGGFAIALLARSAPAAATGGGDQLDLYLADGRAEVARMRQLGERVPADAAKLRVRSICDTADRILGAIAEDRKDPQLALDFLERYLEPAEALLTQYARLATRNVATATSVLAKVETRDLPRLDAKLKELFEQIHRGDVIDLEVTSEMLDFELFPGPNGAPARRTR